jgi:hypothetical protein
MERLSPPCARCRAVAAAATLRRILPASALALTRLRAALPGLPAVEILELGSPSLPPAVIPRAGLVGWLTDRELLVAREGVLTVCDLGGNTGRATSIRVRSAADAFLR